MQSEIEVGEEEVIHHTPSSDFEQSRNEVDRKRNEEEDEEDDFEFSFAGILPESGSSLAPADTIFSNGKILPSYPIFDRTLLLNDYEDSTINSNQNNNMKSVRVPLRLLFLEEEKEQASFSSTSSNSSCLDDLEGVPSDSYCVWTPNDGKKSLKSNSTGNSSSSSSSSSSGRWRVVKDLVMGRSQSDGVTIKSKRGNKSFGKPPIADQEQRKKKGLDRKSYLPYKPDIVGFFANVNLKGLPGNTHKPF